MASKTHDFKIRKIHGFSSQLKFPEEFMEAWLHQPKHFSFSELVAFFVLTGGNEERVL